MPVVKSWKEKTSKIRKENYSIMNTKVIKEYNKIIEEISKMREENSEFRLENSGIKDRL